METPAKTKEEATAETASLNDGTSVRIRPIRADDKALLREVFQRLSPRSSYHRFAMVVRELSAMEIAYLTEVDHTGHVAWVATDTVDGRERAVGVVRYVRSDDNPEVAEVAVTVADSHQGRGLGKLLLGKLAESARANGVQQFLAYVCCENTPLLQFARKLGAHLRFFGSGMMRVTGAVPETLDGTLQSSY